MRHAIFAAMAAAAVALGACNDVGSCPAAADVTPGGSCSGESLQCPYTVQSLSPACDGTMAEGGLQTSCVCTSGSWVCPSPVSCGSTGDDGGDDTGGDGGSGGPGDATTE